MKSFCISLLFILITKFSVANHCYIFMQLQNCNSCNNNYWDYTKIAKSLNPKFVFPENMKSVFKEIDNKYISGNIKDNDIIFADSLINRYNIKAGSYIVVVNDNEKEIYRLKLSEINEYLDIINALAPYIVKVTEEKISKKLILSYSDVIKFSTDYYYFHDYNLHYIVKSKKKSKGKKECKVIDPSNFSYEKLYKEVFKDTNGLSKQLTFYSQVKSKIKSYTKIEGFTVRNDTLHILGSINTYSLWHDTLLVGSNYYIFQYINDKNYKFYYLNAWVNKDYVIASSRDFIYIGDNKYIFSLMKNGGKPPYNFLAEYKIINDTLKFFKLYENELPAVLSGTMLNLSRAEGIFLGNYYAFESCPFLFNYIDPNKSISIKVNGYTDSLNKFSFSSLFYNMHTIWETPHTFKILYQLNGKMYVGCFLKKNGLQINRVLIPEFNQKNGGVSIGCIYFVDEFTLCFASTGTNKIKFYTLE